MSSHVLQSPVGLLQHAGAQIVLIVSGGGSQVIPKLLAEGGGRRNNARGPRPLCKVSHEGPVG
jgi:hypothetical protein